MKQLSVLIVICFLCLQCKKVNTPQEPVLKNTSTTIKYAKGFDIITTEGKKTLLIKRAFQNTEKAFRFTLTNTPTTTKGELQVPINSLVVTSTTHIPMLELLNSENTLIGFPNARYISSVKTRKRIDEGKVADLGSEQDMNTETLLSIQPDLVIGFSLHPNNKLYNNIQKLGIPVLFNGDWLEETPLGRAEWIKVFGALLGKEKEADSIFTAIETEYLKAKKIALKNPNPPTILSGSMFKDIWNVPAGDSYIANFFKDANLNYLWKDTQGTGSLPLNFESVLDKGQQADFWLNCGLFTSKETLLQANKHYSNFKAFTNNNVYSIAHNRGATGGYIYFELSPVRPDWVLKDIIKITQPASLPDYTLHFFNKLD